MRRTLTSADFILSVGLTLLAAFIWYTAKSDGAIGLAGAVFGGAIVLLGNSLGRRAEAARESASTAARKQKLENLITAELRTVAYGLVGAKERFLALAREAAQKPGGQINTATTTLLLPNDLTRTMSLGSELLVLDPAAVGWLITLQESITDLLYFIKAADKLSPLVDVDTLNNYADTTKSIIGVPLLELFKVIAPTAKLSRQVATVFLEQAAK